MEEQQQPARKRRRRGRGGRSGGAATEGGRPEGAPPGPPGPPGSTPPTAQPGPQAGGRSQRQDNRRGRGERPPGEPPGPPSAGRIQRAPGASDRTQREARPQRESRGARDGRPAREGRPQREARPPGRGGERSSRDRDRGTRSFEPPVPQDPRSIELGAAFREAQIVLRDARKALEKRRAEAGDEPEWMLEQVRTAEEAFAHAATEWSGHLETTGRKVVRR